VCEVVCCVAWGLALGGNGVALQWAEMRMVRWMCGVDLQDFQVRVERETGIR